MIRKGDAYALVAVAAPSLTYSPRLNNGFPGSRPTFCLRCAGCNEFVRLNDTTPPIHGSRRQCHFTRHFIYVL